MFWDDLVTLITGSQKLQWTKENKLQFLHLTIMEGMEVSWPVGENGSALETNFTGSLGSPMSIFSSKKFGWKWKEWQSENFTAKSGKRIFKEVCCSKTRLWLGWEKEKAQCCLIFVWGWGKTWILHKMYNSPEFCEAVMIAFSTSNFHHCWIAGDKSWTIEQQQVAALQSSSSKAQGHKTVSC